MANIEFKNETEYKRFLKDKHLTYLNEGSEAKCYLSNVDDLVYKNLLEETYTRSFYSPDEVVTKSQINLPSFAFPIDLHTHQNTVWGYTSKYISVDYFSDRAILSKIIFSKINFNYLKKSLEILKKDTEKISKENILIDDLAFNLIFTGTRLIAIDTLSYLRVEENTLKDNLDSIYYAITSVFDLWLQNIGAEKILEKDLDTYLKEAQIIQKQLKK